MVGSPDQPHSWTYVDDIATTLAAAAELSGRLGPGVARPLQRTPFAERHRSRRAGFPGGARQGRLRYPAWFFGLLAAVSPELRAVRESSYMFDAPFVIDATETERELEVSATPWETALAATVAGYRSSSGR